MLRDAVKRKPPGTAILLTGDGAGYFEGKGFLYVVESLKEVGWNVEVLSWDQSCNVRLQRWVCRHGRFTSLDQFYKSITFVEEPQQGNPGTSLPVDLSKKRPQPWEQFSQGQGRVQSISGGLRIAIAWTQYLAHIHVQYSNVSLLTLFCVASRNMCCGL